MQKLNLNTIIVCITAFACTYILSNSLQTDTNLSVQHATSDASVGRYQLSHKNSDIFRFDTATGRIWVVGTRSILDISDLHHDPLLYPDQVTDSTENP